MIVVGVDGCTFGWVAVAVEADGDHPKLSTICSYRTFEEIVDAFPNETPIAIDIPIGLIECKRAADVEARAVLGKRKSSVFPAPDPRVIHLNDYWETNRLMCESCGKGLSKQSFAIFPKVREVNDVVRRRDPAQERIIEIHPEVCFWAMNKREAMCHPKRSKDGFTDRLHHLRSWIPSIPWNDQKAAGSEATGVEADDVLDAIAAAWTARRWVNGSFGRFPDVPELDRGLRAEIVY